MMRRCNWYVQWSLRPGSSSNLNVKIIIQCSETRRIDHPSYNTSRSRWLDIFLEYKNYTIIKKGKTPILHLIYWYQILVLLMSSWSKEIAEPKNALRRLPSSGVLGMVFTCFLILLPLWNLSHAQPTIFAFVFFSSSKLFLNLCSSSLLSLIRSTTQVSKLGQRFVSSSSTAISWQIVSSSRFTSR